MLGQEIKKGKIKWRQLENVTEKVDSGEPGVSLGSSLAESGLAPFYLGPNREPS